MEPGKRESWRTTMLLAYQSLGVVYGDLSISPLYVYKSTFADDITHSDTNEEILGVLSFVFWTLTLIPLVKYVSIVLRADDNGEGGTFALYSLICRHANVSLLPNRQVADEELSTYRLEHPPEAAGDRRSRVKDWLEMHRSLKTALLVMVMIGTCMVIGDGVLTPAISVFSAVSGLELSLSKSQHEYAVIPITCVILLFLFTLQHYGTHRVGFLFAPIILAWLICMSTLGLYNIFRWNPQVYQALNPVFMLKFLKKTKKFGWMSLGGILLCMTGSEAMFADLGHFSYSSIQLAFTSLVYPALILGYMGQAAFLTQHHDFDSSYQIGFYPHTHTHTKRSMWILPLIGYAGAIIGFCFLTLSIASGLYYLSELVEEHTVVAKRLLTRLIYTVIGIQVILWLVDGFPIGATLLGIFAHVVYLGNMRRFSFVKLSDPLFLLSCVLVLVDHYVWFRHFSSSQTRAYQRSSYYDQVEVPSFSMIASYFGLCVWLVPFALFISLSAGDNVLPTMGTEEPVRGADGKGKPPQGMVKALVDYVRGMIGEIAGSSSLGRP